MTQRRDFLRRASVLAAGTLAAAPLGAAEPQPAVQGTWDMSWTERVTGRHKMAFDAHEVSEGVCLHQARSFLQGYKDVYGLSDRDVSAVLIIRHSAVPMVMTDALWADGMLAEETKLKDPVTGEPTKRNPFINVPAGAQHALTWPDGALDTLISRGVVVLACDLALRNYAGRFARARSIPRQDAVQLVNDNLIPGIYKMPTGVFATCHAQQLGCGVLNAV
ncbi:MAG: hypothetical protein KF689_09285 [Gemmatimonadaceae bacterium]|nr:hypothetical protein [Gemmatimonadaceae bacterium]MCW5826210.1 hypothetical protein [Gemmatimonadaceae bacterium]